MPVSEKAREYDPLQDPRSPLAIAPHWSVTVGMLATVLMAGLTALLSVYDMLATDPLKAVLIAVAAMVASAGTVFGVAHIQGQKAIVQAEGANRIALAKAEGVARVAEAEVTGLPPEAAPAAPVPAQDTTVTTTTTGPLP